MGAKYYTLTDGLKTDLENFGSVRVFAPDQSKQSEADVHLVFNGWADKDDLLELHSIARENGYTVEHCYEDDEGHDRFNLFKK